MSEAGAVWTRGRARAQDVAVPDVHGADGTGAAVLPCKRRTVRHVLGSRYPSLEATSDSIRCIVLVTVHNPCLC